MIRDDIFWNFELPKFHVIPITWGGCKEYSMSITADEFKMTMQDKVLEEFLNSAKFWLSAFIERKKNDYAFTNPVLIVKEDVNTKELSLNVKIGTMHILEYLRRKELKKNDPS